MPGNVPDADHPVLTGGSQPAAVTAQRQPVIRPGIARETERFLAGDRVPDADFAIAARGGQPSVVGAHDNSEGRSPGYRPSEHDLPGQDFPKPDFTRLGFALFAAPGGDESAVGAERHRVDVVRVAGERPSLTPRRHVPELDLTGRGSAGRPVG